MAHNYVNMISFCILATTYTVAGLKIENLIGGLEAINGEILYQAAIIIKGHSFGDPEAPCAAAIVHKDYLVTIASCFTNELGKPFRQWYEVIVGAKTLKDDSAKIVGIEKIYIPQNYDWKTAENNVAVIKVNESFDFSIYTRLTKVDLPISNIIYHKKIAKLSGYGYHLVNIVISDRLIYDGKRDWHWRHLPIRVLDKNIHRFRSSDLNTQFHGNSIAEYKGDQAGACLGDLGGPLVYENQLIGILSKFNPLCDDTHETAVFTKVSSVRPFIESVIDGTAPENTRIDTDQTQTNRPTLSVLIASNAP